MSKWKGRTEDGFLCEGRVPDSQNHLEQSKQHEGSPPDPHAARFHGAQGQRSEWMGMMCRVRADCSVLEGGRDGEWCFYLLRKTAACCLPPPLSLEEWSIMLLLQ